MKVPERFKSPEPSAKISERFRSPEPISVSPEQNGAVVTSEFNGTVNGTDHMDNTEDQGSTRKKVVKVVRRVVRRVLPSEEEDTPTQSEKTQEVTRTEAAKAMPASKSQMLTFSFKHDVVKTEEKDDISKGLTTLMVRGRAREPRVRLRKEERPEKKELEKNLEKKDEKTSQVDVKKEDVAPKTQEADLKPSNKATVLERVKSPMFNVTASETSNPPKPTHSRAGSLPVVVGFIPAPKAPVLSPPPPHNKPTVVTKTTPPNPPQATTSTSQRSVNTPPISVSKPTAIQVKPNRPASGGVTAGVASVQEPAVCKQEVLCPCFARDLEFAVDSAWQIKMHG